jgi:heme exporter protein D
MNWSEFFAMGGYALYVWGSFGVTALLLAGEIVLLRARRRRVLEIEPDEALGGARERTA